jgi:hypothetical protein
MWGTIAACESCSSQENGHPKFFSFDVTSHGFFHVLCQMQNPAVTKNLKNAFEINA